MSADMIRCRKSYYREQKKVVGADEDDANRGRTTSTNGQTSIVVIAAHGRRQKSMGDHHSRGVCRSTSTMIVGQRNLVYTFAFRCNIGVFSNSLLNVDNISMATSGLFYKKIYH